MSRLPLAAAALLAACPAVAETPICGGISPVGAWVGGDAAGSDLVSAATAFGGEGQVPIAGHLVRMFTLGERAAVRIDVRALPSGDPYATVFDAEGAIVAEDDDSLGDLGARVEATLEPGAYCLAARSYDAGVTDVAYAIGRADAAAGDGPVATGDEGAALPDPDAAGCFKDGTPSLGDALDGAAVAAGAGAAAVVEGRASWGFTLIEPVALVLAATSAEGDPVLALLDADFVTVAENDDHDGLDSRIALPDPLPAGDYCVEVEDLSGGGHEIAVSLSRHDPAAERARRLDGAEIAPVDGDGVAVGDLGVLGTSLLQAVEMRAGAQWFAFELPEDGLLVAEALGDGADPALRLFDRAGRLIGGNDDGPEGLDSLLHARLDAGRYTLAVRLLGEGSGVVRLLLERYVPPG